MGPPTYSRSMTTPYPRPTSDRKQRAEGRRESRGEAGGLLLPEFSDLTNTFEVRHPPGVIQLK
jgi:hypothetical protein